MPGGDQALKRIQQTERAADCGLLLFYVYRKQLFQPEAFGQILLRAGLAVDGGEAAERRFPRRDEKNTS